MQLRGCGSFMETIPVLIAINATAYKDDSPEEPMAMLTSGTLSLDNGRAVIKYEETLDENYPPQKVEMTVADDCVTMLRAGHYELSMVFSKGQRFEGQYKTPFGTMELALYCTRLNAELTRDGGEITLSYQLDLNGQFASMNDMELRLIPQGDA